MISSWCDHCWGRWDRNSVAEKMISIRMPAFRDSWSPTLRVLANNFILIVVYSLLPLCAVVHWLPATMFRWHLMGRWLGRCQAMFRSFKSTTIPLATGMSWQMSRKQPSKTAPELTLKSKQTAKKGSKWSQPVRGIVTIWVWQMASRRSYVDKLLSSFTDTWEQHYEILELKEYHFHFNGPICYLQCQLWHTPISSRQCLIYKYLTTTLSVGSFQSNPTIPALDGRKILINLIKGSPGESHWNRGSGKLRRLQVPWLIVVLMICCLEWYKIIFEIEKDIVHETKKVKCLIQRFKNIANDADRVAMLWCCVQLCSPSLSFGVYSYLPLANRVIEKAKRHHAPEFEKIGQ